MCECVFCEYLKLPEDAACVSMVVLSQRDVFNSSLVAFQVALHVFKEPGFKMQADPIYLMSNRKKGRLNVIRREKQVTSTHAHKHLTLSGSA